MAKHKIRNLKVLKQIFEVSMKILCRKWEGEILPKQFFIFKQLEKCQNKYVNVNVNLIRFCRCTCLHVPHFPTKKDSVIILKMTNF